MEETPKTDRRVADEGYFVKPKLLIAEVRVRLASTGKSGERLTDQAIARENIHEVSDCAWEALMYCTGRRRRGMDFNAWCWQRRYRSKRKLNEIEMTRNI